MRSGRLWRIGLVYGLVAALAAFCLHLVSLTPLWLDWGRELVAAVIALAGVVVGLKLRERARDRSAAPADLLRAAVPAAPANAATTAATTAAASAATSAAPAPTDAPPLTRSELAILRLLAQGHSNKALARALNVSENTVKTHLANLYAKLGVGRRVDAVLMAQRLGLVGLPGMPDASSSESPAAHPNFTRPGDGSTG